MRKVALITGASAGIGRATAIAFARAGYAVGALARSGERLEKLRRQVESRLGAPLLPLVADVGDREQVAAAVQETVARFGGIDVLVANAGIGHYGRVVDTSPEAFEQLWRTNVMGVVHAVQLTVPVMREGGGGHIAIVGSVVGHRSWPYHGPYAATKFALVALSQALRAELADEGITVSLISPGSTKTEFFERAQVEGEYRPRPIGPAQKPSTVARAILRSVERPKAEIVTVPGLRSVLLLGEVLPGAADRAARWWVRRQARR